jgi:hypothetical protein
MRPSAVEWRDLLTRWSDEIADCPDVAQRLPADALTSRWLGLPPASEAQIRVAEARLGTTLPPCYRQFLSISNGWRTTGFFIDNLYSCEEIRWFRQDNQPWIDAYVSPPFPYDQPMPRVSDAEYFVYGKQQDSARFRQEYLQTALEISAEGDSAIYLLNPETVTPDGEWEAWFFANWLPGAVRYRSFWEMMIGEHESFVGLAADKRAHSH